MKEDAKENADTGGSGDSISIAILIIFENDIDL